jgi:predicted phage terminase large subunit-like protein
MLTDAEIIRLKELVRDREIENARKNLLDFTVFTFPKFQKTPFHQTYYRILDLFAKDKIKRLIVTVPPQHGKSQGSTRHLPAFIFGINPDSKIAIASYNTTFARKFNRDIQRIIDEENYRAVFPKTELNQSNVVTVTNSYLRNADEFEIVGKEGSLKAVGRGGPLTGNPVDVIIMDDLYKDYAEGNSPIVRESGWDWYTSVVKTRLHNDSKELIVFTRWHENDLIGRLEKHENVITVKTWDEIKNASEKDWIKINFEAIKTGDPTELDPRQKGEPLFPFRHSIEKLYADRATDPVKFDALYQGDPISKQGLLYGNNFKVYTTPPDVVIVRKNYTDSADMGNDYLCSIDYDITPNGLIYIHDVIYTQEPMEITEPLLSNNLIKNNVRYCDMESNNGGRGFARKIEELTKGKVKINWFHQAGNKESRIITNAATVMQKIVMPSDWHIRWPEFYDHVTRFKRNFRANRHDDAPDVLTGIIETSDKIKTGRNLDGVFF